MNIKRSFQTGISFGLTSSIITTLGLMIGLNAGTHSRLAVIGAIITIAVADALSDSLGIHISEEAKKEDNRSIWEATCTTFITKFIFTLTFLVPTLLFSLGTAIIINLFWGLLVLSTLSFFIARNEKSKPSKIILEHIMIAGAVMIISQLLGELIYNLFR